MLVAGTSTSMKRSLAIVERRFFGNKSKMRKISRRTAGIAASPGMRSARAAAECGSNCGMKCVNNDLRHCEYLTEGHAQFEKDDRLDARATAFSAAGKATHGTLLKIAPILVSIKACARDLMR
ncbi:hypothetical protein EVAR_62019_1, partial [Eumeta japonica]